MKRRSHAVVLVLALALALSAVGAAQSATTTRANGATTTCAGAISWRSATSAVGKVVTIKGWVAGTHYASSSNGAPTFLNLGLDYPAPGRFVVVIWAENRARFGVPENRYAARTLCVRGRVSLYQGVAQIEATTPSQIRVVG